LFAFGQLFLFQLPFQFLTQKFKRLLTQSFF
jgi:hypothetical protein